MFEERRLETARELLARGCAELVRRDTPLEPALQLIESALLISPMLRSCAVRTIEREREGGRRWRGYVERSDVRARSWTARSANLFIKQACLYALSLGCVLSIVLVIIACVVACLALVCTTDFSRDMGGRCIGCPRLFTFQSASLTSRWMNSLAFQSMTERFASLFPFPLSHPSCGRFSFWSRESYSSFFLHPSLTPHLNSGNEALPCTIKALMPPLPTNFLPVVKSTQMTSSRSSGDAWPQARGKEGGRERGRD